MGSKLMLGGVIMSAKGKDQPLLKEDSPEPTAKATKGSSFKQVRIGVKTKNEKPSVKMFPRALRLSEIRLLRVESRKKKKK